MSPPIILPSGLPAWITADLVAETIRVWQPYYEESLTVDDALGIIKIVGHVLESVLGESEDETVRRPGSGEQS